MRLSKYTLLNFFSNFGGEDNLTENEASFATNGFKRKRPKIHERVANFFRKQKKKSWKA